MKKFIKYILILIIPVLITGITTTSCKDDDSDGGTPVIQYVRVTDPAKSDSLLEGAYMGDLIAIIGENLGGTREIWFNDQKAVLNPAYVTDHTIILNVPSNVPNNVDNRMKLVYKNSDTLKYNFAVNIPSPIINSIKCEYVPDGDSVVLNGDYYFNPKVIFPGDKEGEILSFTKNKIQVKVPAGVASGPITIKTKFGTIKSKFNFRDNTNVILDFDTYIQETWTAGTAKASDNPTPAPCSGNYVYLRNSAVGAWMWTNELTMQYWAERGIRGNVPLAKGNPGDLVFRFEVNVPIAWKEVRMEIVLGTYGSGTGRNGNAFIARWKPWANGAYTTNGWVTVSIPLTDFKYGPDDPDESTTGTKTISANDLSSLTNLTMMLFGPATGTNPVNVNIDNVRIVSK